MKLPLISVIIPVYNVEKYLRRCVETVRNQTYHCLEIILVDDGSTDCSGKICDDLKEADKRIKVIHKQNGGLSSARNAGIRAARGAYLGFVDSDDWILPEMYMDLYRMIASGDYDISVCGLVRAYSKDSVKYVPELYSRRVYTKDEYLKKILKVKTQDSNHYACNKLYKKSIFKNIKYPEGLTCEDVEGTFLAVTNAAKIIESKKTGYIYYVNPASITASKFSQKNLDYLEICDRIILIAKRKCTSEIVRHTVLFRYRADFGLLCKIAVSDIDKDFDKDFYIRQMVTALRKHCKSLIQDSIPVSRKFMILCMCINYPATEKIMRCAAKFIGHRMQLRY